MTFSSTTPPLLLARPIPGIPFEYIPNQGAIQAFELQDRMMIVAVACAGLFFLFGAFLVLRSQWDAPQPWWALGKNFVVVAVLLSCYYFVFSVPLVIARAAAWTVFSNTDLAALNRDIQEAAAEETGGRAGGAGNDPQGRWYQRLFTLVAVVLNPQEMMTADIVLALTTVAFYVAVPIMIFIWKWAVIVLFATGPLMIVAGLIGGWGEQILAKWLTAHIQISLWQVWFAACTFFIRSGDDFFITSLGRVSSVPNHYESIALCVLFTAAFVMTGKIVNTLVPFSGASAGIAGGLSAGMTRLTGTPKRIVSVGTNTFKRSVGKGK